MSRATFREAVQTAIPIQRAATFHQVHVRFSGATGARSSFQRLGSGAVACILFLVSFPTRSRALVQSAVGSR